MPTAQSYQANLPDISLGNMPADTGASIWSRAGTFFGAKDYSQAYQNALTENNRAYEQAMLKESRDYDEYLRQYNAQREDTQVQRMVKDIKAAGLNPWLALQGGLSGSGSSAQTAGSPSYSSASSAKSSKHESSGVSSLALLLVSAARLVAAMA